MKLPTRELHKDTDSWVTSICKNIERYFQQNPKEDDSARIDSFAVAIPDTHLLADGSEFLIESAPNLARKLGDTFGAPSSAEFCVLPDLVAANPWGADTYVGIKK